MKTEPSELDIAVWNLAFAGGSNEDLYRLIEQWAILDTDDGQRARGALAQIYTMDLREDLLL